MGSNFRESPKRPSKLFFVVLNFVTATSSGAWHCCTNDDVINTCAHDLLVTEPYLQRLGQIAWDGRILVWCILLWGRAFASLRVHDTRTCSSGTNYARDIDVSMRASRILWFWPSFYSFFKTQLLSNGVVNMSSLACHKLTKLLWRTDPFRSSFPSWARALFYHSLLPSQARALLYRTRSLLLSSLSIRSL